MKNIACVIVLYNPNLDYVTMNITRILNTCRVVLIDNSKIVHSVFNTYPQLTYLPLMKNVGIASALNVGIKEVQKMRGIDYVVLFDQDSYLSSQLILKLYETQKKVSGLKSVVAPLPLNRITNEPYRLTILGRYKGLLEVREMLNSGMFIPLCLFSEVGMMDEYLFIDGVDSEWCWRAMNKGIHLFVNPQIKMEHMLGEGDKYLLGKRISIPAPVRTYYQFRNYCILLMRSYVPFNWKLINGIKYTVKFIYYSLCVSPRISYLQKMILGIRDGIRYCLRSLFCA